MGVIDEARAMFARREPWWPHPLILTLENARPGLGFEWVLRCVRLLLPLSGTDKREQLAADLDRLEGYCARCPALEELVEEARAIWYRPPGRDAAQTAVSQLFEAFAYLRYGTDGAYRRTLCAPFTNFLTGSDWPTEMGDLIVGEFIEFAGERHIDCA